MKPESVSDMARSTGWAAQDLLQCTASQPSRRLPATVSSLFPFTPTPPSTSAILQQLRRRSAVSPPRCSTRAFSSEPSSTPPQAAPRTPPTPADSVSVPPPTPSSSSSSSSPSSRVPPKTPPKQADKVPVPQPLPFQNAPAPKPQPSISPKEWNAFAVSQLSARGGPGAGAASTRKMDPKVSWEERYRTRSRKYV